MIHPDAARVMTGTCYVGATGQGPAAERATGVEPAFQAWKASALPLSYARTGTSGLVTTRWYPVEMTGVEPVSRRMRFGLNACLNPSSP